MTGVLKWLLLIQMKGFVYLSAFAIYPSASFVKRLARVLAVQRCAVQPVTPGYLKNDFFFSRA